MPMLAPPRRRGAQYAVSGYPGHGGACHARGGYIVMGVATPMSGVPRCGGVCYTRVAHPTSSLGSLHLRPGFHAVVGLATPVLATPRRRWVLSARVGLPTSRQGSASLRGVVSSWWGPKCRRWASLGPVRCSTSLLGLGSSLLGARVWALRVVVGSAVWSFVTEPGSWGPGVVQRAGTWTKGVSGGEGRGKMGHDFCHGPFL